MKLIGQVKSGKNDFSFWMNKLSSYYTAKTGIIFFPGTLNVHLIDCKYYFPQNCLRLEKEEYDGIVSISMTKCRFMGENAYILRTDSDIEKYGYPPEQILEIAANLKLRDKFNLRDGDIVSVEVDEGEIIKVST